MRRGGVLDILHRLCAVFRFRSPTQDLELSMIFRALNIHAFLLGLTAENGSDCAVVELILLNHVALQD
jgi:hypothetical protein